LRLNLNSFLVFFIDSTDQVKTLLLALESELLSAQLFLLLLLTANHMFHGLSLELVRLFLHVDHFLMLSTLLFQAFSFPDVVFILHRFVVGDLVLLHSTFVFVFLLARLVFSESLPLKLLLFFILILVALAHLHDLNRLLFGVLDFFPGFLFLELEESDAVGQQLDIVLSTLLAGSLLGEGRADDGLAVAIGAHLVAIVGIVWVLHAVDIIGAHVAILVSNWLIRRAIIDVSSCTL